jgi:hypothetical protein
MKESEQQVHRYILDQIYRIGEVNPKTFAEVIRQEPGLLERYLRSCGIDVQRAEITDTEDSRIHMNLQMEDPELDSQFAIRFLKQEA